MLEIHALLEVSSLEKGENNAILGTRNQISADVMKITSDIGSLKVRYSSIIDLINNSDWLLDKPSNTSGKILLKKHKENSLYDKIKKEVNHFQTHEYLLIDEVYNKSLIKLLEQSDKFDELGLKTSSACVGYRGISRFTYSIEN
ncbi:MAG: hypothetical protein PHS49_02550 [Candidatus Gracilibacteria bacterium]|nr:hypothetical protein [Candidatus Gracilibacteria bacterium]